MLGKKKICQMHLFDRGKSTNLLCTIKFSEPKIIQVVITRCSVNLASIVSALCKIRSFSIAIITSHVFFTGENSGFFAWCACVCVLKKLMQKCRCKQWEEKCSVTTKMKCTIRISLAIVSHTPIHAHSMRSGNQI